MSTVQEIEAAIPRLTRTEVEELRAWIEDYLEDQLELTDEVTASLDARSRIGGGDGGVVEIVSTGSVFVRGSIIASSDCRIDETCLSTGGEENHEGQRD